MRVLLALAAIILLAVGAASGCAGAAPPRGSETGSAVSAPRLGEPGCRPASPLSEWGPASAAVPQVQGTAHGATLWGLLMFPHLPARVGDQEKIVWRMTGSGTLTLAAIAPDGGRHRPAWGPSAHAGSNWTKPGDEWGAGYVFTEPGCWDLRATRGMATADVWLRVVAG